MRGRGAVVVALTVVIACGRDRSVSGRASGRGDTIAGVPVAAAHVDAAPHPDSQWTIAARQIRRFSPISFPDLPKPFMAELERLGCTVPQSDYGEVRGLTNVIQGSFGAPGQHDWAVLCSRGGTSVILVNWGGPAQCPREFRSASDADYLQGLGEGHIGFSRGIYKTNTYHQYPDENDTASVEEDVKLEHDAIEDAFEGKASTVYFCRNGVWVAFSGAD